jgi:hypothetical protein
MKIVEKINTHFVFNNFFLRDNVQEYSRARQATDNMAHAHCVLDN